MIYTPASLLNATETPNNHLGDLLVHQTFLEGIELHCYVRAEIIHRGFCPSALWMGTTLLVSQVFQVVARCPVSSVAFFLLFFFLWFSLLFL